MWPNEAEKRPGTLTDYYLITDEGNHRVIEVQAQGTSGGTVVWQYGQTGIFGSGTNQLKQPVDAMRLICGTILIVDSGNNRVIEVQPTGTSGGTIVWECSNSTGLPIETPVEAIRMSNWNTLIADGGNHRVIEVRTGDYPNFGTASIVWQQGQTGVSGSDFNQLFWPDDIEELGIINIAKAEYQDATGKAMPKKFAGVVVPLLLPTANLPEIELTKMVYPGGPQQIGAILTYTINYYNRGSGTASNVKITDMVPESTEYIMDSVKVLSGPPATIESSHDGGINFDSFFDVSTTHIRWSIPTVVPPDVGGTLEFQVRIK